MAFYAPILLLLLAVSLLYQLGQGRVGLALRADVAGQSDGLEVPLRVHTVGVHVGEIDLFKR